MNGKRSLKKKKKKNIYDYYRSYAVLETIIVHDFES